MADVTLASLLTDGPEVRLLKAAAEIVKADPILSWFQPILIVEVASVKAMLAWGSGTLVIQPVTVKPADKPSRRSTSFFSIWISAYLPGESREEDSKLEGTNLLNVVRKLFWGEALREASTPISFATTEVAMLTPLVGVSGSTRILTYQVTVETDIDPRVGDFTG